ncbi:MAG: universal stress protein [Halofilum sp. (in: g-proteobacteria)]|nr:universal stress protein [Halofilum sp. (in: g-proteobacteria)]
MSNKAKLLLATDLSDNAKPAAVWAQGFGEAGGADVHLVHVVEISAANWASGAYALLEEARLQDQAREKVTQWYAEATGGEPAGVDVRVGTPATQLAEAVRDSKADLLVVARTGKRAWERFLVGSTARALALDPPCELVIVHPEHGRAEVGNIVLGTDFSENAGRALAFAAGLARRYGAKLHIVHAEEVDELQALDALAGELIPTEHRRAESERASSERLADLVQNSAAELEGVEHTTRALTGMPARALAEYCKKGGADLLVVGRAGHSALLAHVLGSVVNGVLQAAPTHLVIVPAA